MAALVFKNAGEHAMNWMYQSRSDNFCDEEGASSPPMQWHEIPLAILYFILFLIYFTIIEFLIPIGLICHEFYSTAKRVSESGKLDSPGLVVTGILLATTLLILVTNHLFDVTNHPFITICSSALCLFFTLAPLTGLVWRLFK